MCLNLNLRQRGRPSSQSLCRIRYDIVLIVEVFRYPTGGPEPQVDDIPSYKPEVTAIVAATPILKQLNDAVIEITHIAPIAGPDCVWNTMSTAHTPDDADDSPWQSLDPRLNCILGADVSSHALDQLIVVGPYGLCQAVNFLSEITIKYGPGLERYPVTPALYEGKVQRLIEAIARRYTIPTDL